MKHLKLVVNTVLQGNTRLRSVYLELRIAREGYLKQPMVSDAIEDTLHTRPTKITQWSEIKSYSAKISAVGQVEG